MGRGSESLISRNYRSFFFASFPDTPAQVLHPLRYIEPFLLNSMPVINYFAPRKLCGGGKNNENHFAFCCFEHFSNRHQHRFALPLRHRLRSVSEAISPYTLLYSIREGNGKIFNLFTSLIIVGDEKFIDLLRNERLRALCDFDFILLLARIRVKERKGLGEHFGPSAEN